MFPEGKRAVVVGVDFGPGGDQAILEGVKRVAEGQATELHAVHVFDPRECPSPAAMPGLFTEKRFLELGPWAIRNRVDEIARSQSATLLPNALQAHARICRTVDILLQLAADYDADLIVIGSHARQPVHRLLGSVAELLVRTAACDVLVASSKDHSMLLPRTQRPAPSYRPGELPAARTGPADPPLQAGGLRIPADNDG
jgi:nucleotide-binding universal stress UspA family protein